MSDELHFENPKLKVNDLDFYYGKYQAIKKVTLDIPANKVTAFIGPSGCGKSTLLRTFNRLYELYPDQRAEGEIRLDGNNILDKQQDITLLRAKVRVPVLEDERHHEAADRTSNHQQRPLQQQSPKKCRRRIQREDGSIAKPPLSVCGLQSFD